MQSQRGEIGLSKALGYRDWQILLHYLVFSLIIAFTGSIIGSVLGQYFGKLINEMYVELLNIPILKHQIHPDVIIGAVMVSSIFCILAGIVPAFASARMLPAEAMRFDPGVALSKGKIPIVERIFGWMIPSSLAFRIPLRNIFRLRRRSVYTIIGIAFAMILTVVGISINDSTNYMLDAQDKTEKWDIFAVFGQNFSSEQVNQVKDFEGVEKVQAVLMVPAKLEANGKKHEGPITAVQPDADFHRFNISEGDEPEEALTDNELILARTLAEKLDVSVGDELGVNTPYLKKAVDMKVKAISDEMWGSPIFTSVDQGQKLIDSKEMLYNGLYVNSKKEEATEIRDKLYELPGAYTVQKKGALTEYIKSAMGLVLVFVAVVLAFAFMMAFVVIYTTFTANVIERTREVATMMTIGEDRRHLAFMITMENIALAVVGIPIGIVLGMMANQSMYESLSTEAYTIPSVLYPTSIVLITVGILVVLLLSEIPPIRRIFRMDLAEATKAIE